MLKRIRWEKEGVAIAACPEAESGLPIEAEHQSEVIASSANIRGMG